MPDGTYGVLRISGQSPANWLCFFKFLFAIRITQHSIRNKLGLFFQNCPGRSGRNPTRYEFGSIRLRSVQACFFKCNQRHNPDRRSSGEAHRHKVTLPHSTFLACPDSFYRGSVLDIPTLLTFCLVSPVFRILLFYLIRLIYIIYSEGVVVK